MNLWLPKLFVQFYGLTVKHAVANVLYISFFSIAGRFLVYFLSEKVGRKLFIIIGFTMAGIMLFCMTKASVVMEFFWIAAIYQFFIEMGLCGSTIYTPEIYPVHIRVLGTSTSMGLGRIGGAIGGYAVGYFLGAGQPTQMWIFLGTGCLIAGVLTIVMGVEPKGQNLEQLNREGTEGAAKRREEERETVAVAE